MRVVDVSAQERRPVIAQSVICDAAVFLHRDEHRDLSPAPGDDVGLSLCYFTEYSPNWRRSSVTPIRGSEGSIIRGRNMSDPYHAARPAGCGGRHRDHRVPEWCDIESMRAVARARRFFLRLCAELAAVMSKQRRSLSVTRASSLAR